MKITAEKLVEILRERNIEPDETFCAAAGQDYGFVAAWNLPWGSARVIRYGDNGETNYELDDTDTELSEWLISDEVSGIDALLQEATVLGIDAVEAATSEDSGPFTILETHDFYGPTSRTRVAQDDDGKDVEFDTIEEAQAWIDNEEDGDYYCLHNESGRPSYKIVTVL